MKQIEVRLINDTHKTTTLFPSTINLGKRLSAKAILLSSICTVVYAQPSHLEKEEPWLQLSCPQQSLESTSLAEKLALIRNTVCMEWGLCTEQRNKNLPSL
jgi:hypothetical protein